jgi:predicted RNA methylase
MARKKKIVDEDQLFFDFDYIELDLFLAGDLRNIRKMLPTLYDHQVEDVGRAENRYKDGKGYLITNGTGVGKTYVGLGVAKRFYENDKREILIVVPTDKKAGDWIKDAFSVGLSIYRLSGILDPGYEITVTTYANFYQNEELAAREFDLVIYDECHYLNQNAAGNGTSALAMHRIVSNLPSEARVKAIKLIPEYPVLPDNDDFDYTYNEYVEVKNKHYLDKNAWELEKVKKTIEIVDSTKVLFLSATPFAYHKSIKYADGSLFDIDETVIERTMSYGYNEAVGFEKFLVENFGYSMRHNRVTKPGPEINLDLLERNFFEESAKKGVMSTRVLQLDYDYSREFITLDSDLGDVLDEGMRIFHDKDTRKKYPNLAELSKRNWTYLNLTQLLECIKARECVDRIQEHLDLGRKIVVFHTFNHSKIFHPFVFTPDILLLTGEQYLTTRLNKEIFEFNIEFSEFVNLDLSDLQNPRDAITSVYPYAKEYNGTVNKKKRSKYLDDFNQDFSMTDIVLVQTKAGREGISLHDVTGERPRVIVNLGLPTAPTQAIQEEGRIYRSGLKSNAVYEYMTLQTDFERHAFATKIAERSKTAENLAMGNLARDLERSFKDGYSESSYERPSLSQGVGGKEKDRAMLTITPFERAKTYYYMKQKKNARNKAKEGVDYFATPEPLGYMLVKWIDKDLQEVEAKAEKWMEPSVGHGAIARFFPKNTKNVFIEPSSYLASQAAINCSGEVKTHDFEGFHFINKFDYIVMNPPFGSSGKTAMEHLEKACTHLERYDSRLLAIIPNGPAMDKRFDEFMNDAVKFNHLSFTGEIILPNITFARAGTKVSCRVVRIERNYMMPPKEHFERIDLTYIEDVNEFFDTIENIEFKTK